MNKHKSDDIDKIIADPTITISGFGELSIGKYTKIEKNTFFHLGDNHESFIIIGYRCKIKYGSVYRCYDGFIDIGDRTSIGEYTIIAGHGGVTIGSCVIISGHCYIASSEHIFRSQVPIRFQGETAKGIKIGDGVWVGAHCSILDGVKIGNNTIIGAGSVVTQNLPANFLCFGIPCKPIKKIIN